MKQAIEIFQSNNLSIDHLDLGGGFGIAYDNTQNQFDINKLATLIDDTFPDPSFKISFEPGRYLVANAGYLVTKILICKQNGGINFLITDAGMHTLLRPAMYNAFHKIIPFNQKGRETTYTIAGPICESSDVLVKDIMLPTQKKDNLLIICDVGAYGAVMASNYNSKCLPAEVLVNQTKYAIIRHQENIETLISRDKLPDWL
jgi:diaminopimelate decarboxylase